MTQGHSEDASTRRSRLLRGLVLLAAVFATLAGVAWVGMATRDWLRSSDRYAVSCADIDCAAPPHLDREQFLAEVRYLADLPEQFSLLDDDLVRRLADAFALHPWVARVERVHIVPPRQVRVHLTFRTPVLRVSLAKRTKVAETDLRDIWVGAHQLVDAEGRTLPGSKDADFAELPVLGPRVSDLDLGEKWQEPNVAEAARIAALLVPHQEKLAVTRVTSRPSGFSLHTKAGSRILWGRSPGQEGDGEVSAEEKIRRLLDYAAQHGSLDGPDGPRQHDVRPSGRMITRSLPP